MASVTVDEVRKALMAAGMPEGEVRPGTVEVVTAGFRAYDVRGDVGVLHWPAAGEFEGAHSGAPAIGEHVRERVTAYAEALRAAGYAVSQAVNESVLVTGRDELRPVETVAERARRGAARSGFQPVGTTTHKAPGSVEALIGDAGSEIGAALAGIGVAAGIIAGLIGDERVDVTAGGWQQVIGLLQELPDLGPLHELRRLCAVLAGDYVPGPDGGPMRLGDSGGDTGSWASPERVAELLAEEPSPLGGRPDQVLSKMQLLFRDGSALTGVPCYPEVKAALDSGEALLVRSWDVDWTGAEPRVVNEVRDAGTPEAGASEQAAPKAPGRTVDLLCGWAGTETGPGPTGRHPAPGSISHAGPSPMWDEAVARHAREEA